MTTASDLDVMAEEMLNWTMPESIVKQEPEEESGLLHSLFREDSNGAGSHRPSQVGSDIGHASVLPDRSYHSPAQPESKQSSSDDPNQIMAVGPAFTRG